MWLNANEEIFAGYADPGASYPDADPDAILNLNTGYADTDAYLCIRIMSLCCIIKTIPEWPDTRQCLYILNNATKKHQDR